LEIFKYLIFNNLARGMSVAIHPDSTTKHYSLPQNSRNLLVPYFELLGPCLKIELVVNTHELDTRFGKIERIVKVQGDNQPLNVGLLSRPDGSSL
jgi:hypothetical protein